ncbi:hypothetical protein CYJ57_06585 [Falseniella ignava]|uniref:Gram-positive cocci surface proteins LPxTG domain-containing protein n=1 Tax=Falseniella ignava TaxID=137730 RepID=A0A2I1JWV2_9LACT|nr:LPXTG cell wall anchor domain-containing protein [Falseniella ignava]PKY87856.1 hypothetical protein CYJ57_06585 [Falseniella ignava]
MRKSLLKFATICSLFILGSTNVVPSIVSFGDMPVAQAQDLSAAIETVKELRALSWEQNLPYNGTSLQALYPDKNAYVSAVYWAPGLAEAAQIRAKEQENGLDHHTRPNGTEWSTVFSQTPSPAGEILAKGQSSIYSAITDSWGAGEVQALIDAQGFSNGANGHLHNLLNIDLKYIGFAEHADGNGVVSYVGILAGGDIPLGSALPLPEETESTTTTTTTVEETEEDSTTTTTVEVTEESSSTTTTEEPETSSSTTTTVEPETSSSTTTTTVEPETSSSTTTTTVEPETSSSTTTTTVEPETSSSTTTTTTVEETEASSSTTTTTVESTTAAPVTTTTTTTVEYTTAAPVHSVSIYPVAVGSQVVSGITTADAHVTVTIKHKAQSRSVFKTAHAASTYTTKADKQGAYSVKLSEPLKAGDIIEVSSTINGQTAVATKHVVAASSSTTQTATTTTAETTTKEGLPKTGETNNWIIMLAAALAVVAGIFLIAPGRRNKKQ